MFRFWWNPIVAAPDRYGLLKRYNREPSVYQNINSLMKLLRAIFHQELLEENAGYLSSANKFILSKS